MSNIDLALLQKKAREIRLRLIQISNRTHTAHLASCLSAVDLVVALYLGWMNVNRENIESDDRDRFILSKGHAANLLYTILAEIGVIPAEILDHIGQAGGMLGEHPERMCVPGVEVASGSLGHGLPLACGIALGARLRKQQFDIFVLMGDGECNEGSVWEAAMFASANNLEQITVLIDFNKWQGIGRSTEILSIEPLKDKWKTFGWHSVEIDGHNFEEILTALNTPGKPGCPRAIVAHTIKGKGISFMEDDNNWHYRIPTEEEVEKARIELGL